MSVETEAITYAGRLVPATPECLGRLRSSADIREDPTALRARLAADGYLYCPGVLPTDAVLDARRSIIEALAAEGFIEPGTSPLDAIFRRDRGKVSFRPDLANGNAAVAKLLYGPAMMGLFERVLGEPVRHFDFTWLRAKSPGAETMTQPHCDIVYMGRGTRDRLLTAWTPLGDVPVEMGGLAILEGSHRRADSLRAYWETDVDAYCTNGQEAEEIRTGRRVWESVKQNGAYGQDAVAVRDELGGRWLVADYAAGDVLLFSMFTVHASFDNRTNRIRLSTDSRYQPASEPADPRWIGEHPPGHSLAAKVGMIC
jgi:hypothetical protein